MPKPYVTKVLFINYILHYIKRNIGGCKYAKNCVFTYRKNICTHVCGFTSSVWESMNITLDRAYVRTMCSLQSSHNLEHNALWFASQ